jgi:queuine/archaeosine tRNA-ribosyltransferase
LTRRLAPLLAGTSAGSLGPADLEEIGITIVAVDVLELRLGPGLDTVHAAGGLGAFIGWDGPIVAIARYSDEAPGATGWRARGLPQLLRADGDSLTLRSAVDGDVVIIALEQLQAETAGLGAGTGDEADRVAVWIDVDGPQPASDIVVTELGQAQAAEGRYYDRGAWRDISQVPAGPLAPTCGCRACRVAGGAYLAHLWAVREITAQHLLTWHNVHQLRLVVEAGEEA